MRSPPRTQTTRTLADLDARYVMHYEITEEELAYLATEVEKLKTLVEEVCLGRLSLSHPPEEK